MIWSRPSTNSERFRHTVSMVYAPATRSGSRVFQAASAASTLSPSTFRRRVVRVVWSGSSSARRVVRMYILAPYENNHSRVKGTARMPAPMSEFAEPDRVPFGDLVGPGLRALIVAINPSTQSAGIGHSFSSPSNAFWRLLHESGLTPMRLQPSEEHRLLDHGLGLVSTVSRPTSSAAALSLAERRAGAARVHDSSSGTSRNWSRSLGLTLYPPERAL